jgi:membrane protease YdiL (CAAX protease family)
MKNKYNDLVDGLTDKELLFHLYMTQIILLTISLLLGFLLFDDFAYLNTIHFDDFQIIYIGLPVGIIVVVIDIVLMKWLPSSYYDDGGLNERIFRNRSIFQIILIAALVAFSEELLFRGIIQTKFGLILASIIFAIIHYRYLFNWFLFVNIVVLSFFIGLIYAWTDNIVVTIVIHFVIDFLLGLHIKFRRIKMVDEQNKEEWLHE